MDANSSTAVDRKDVNRRVGIYGPFGWGNLGDAAIQEAMMSNLRARIPGVEIIGFSLNPQDTKKIHGIDAVAITRHGSNTRSSAPSGIVSSGSSFETTPLSRYERMKDAIRRVPLLYALAVTTKRLLGPLRSLLDELRFLFGARKTLLDFDVLIISGGGQLSDFWGGAWYHPYTLFKWIACARLASTKVFVVSVGAGPLRLSLSRLFLSLALRMAHYRSYRDEESQQLISQFGFTRDDAVFPDLAFSLPTEWHRSATARTQDGPLIGVSPISFCHPAKGAWPKQDPRAYEEYVDKMAAFSASLLDRGLPVKLFTSQIRHDALALDDLLPALDGRGWSEDDPSLQVNRTTDLENLLGQISETDVVITSRLHGVILSYFLHKPVLGLSYHPKIRSVMKQFGQEEYCVDLENFSLEQLQERFDSLLDNLEDTRRKVRERALQHRERLTDQYDRLFGRRLDAEGPDPRLELPEPHLRRGTEPHASARE